jgi:hypothetical protein
VKKFTLVFVLTMFVMLLAISSASAAPADVTDYQATFIAFDGTGKTIFGVPVDVHKVVTYSATEKVTYTISGILPDAVYVTLPTQAVQYSTGHNGYYVCTYDAPYWKYTVSPSGNFSYTCRSDPF